MPQWNCGCPNCAAARADPPRVRPRTQSSVAVSADGASWVLLNASPDVREQLRSAPELGPAPGVARGTRVAACVLTDGELDHTMGLLLLREGESFDVLATPAVTGWLGREFPVAPILATFATRRWRPLRLGEAIVIAGLAVRVFETGRRAPRYANGRGQDAAGAVVGLAIGDAHGGRLVYAPSVEPAPGAGPPPALAAEAERADAVLVDGTFWSDDELEAHGGPTGGARAMGHWPVGGEGGSLPWLAGVPARTRLYVHVNNTNPMLAPGSPERRAVEAGGIAIAEDGDTLRL